MNSRMSLKSLLTFTLALLMVVGCVAGLTSIKASAADGDVYTKVTSVSDLKVGDQIVIVANTANYALSTNQKSNNRGAASITKSGDTVTLSADTQVITLGNGTASGSFSFSVGNGYLYAAGGTGKNNYLKTQTTLSAAGSWNITISSSGTATIKCADSSVQRHTLMYNSQSTLFSCYASGQQAVAIYKLGASCDHSNTNLVNAKPATCTEDGYTGDTVCTNSDCGEVVSKGSTISALGHDYKDVETEAPTCTSVGHKDEVCANCDDVRASQVEIPMIDHVDADENGHCDECNANICKHTSTRVENAVDAGCETEGYTGDTICNDCEYTVPGEDIDPKGHNEAEAFERVAEAPTCTEAGSKEIVCPDCEQVIRTESIDPKGHGETTVDEVKATCTTDGSRTTKCTVCGATTATETLKSPGHQYEDGACTVCGAEQPSEATISFADKANRTEYSTSKQVWMQNGITVTNDKGNVGDYANPVRFYKGTTVTIEAAGMTTIIFDCSNTEDTKYYTAVKDSLKDAGYTFTEVGKVLTVTFTDPVDSISFTCAAQARVNSITVAFATAGGCEHEWGDWETVTDATIFEKGSQERHCGLCDDVQTQEIPAIADVELPIPEANELGKSKAQGAYTDGKYYVTGVIVQIDNTEWGNVYIEDADGNRFYIYGLYSADGKNRYDAMENAPQLGDTITAYGVVGNYKGDPQMKSAWVVAHTPAAPAPVVPEASITEVVLNVRDNLAVKFLVSANSSAVEAGMTLEVTFNGGTVVLTPVEVEGQLMFVFEGVAPQLMGKNISVVFKVGDEVKYERAEWSVRSYLLEMVDDETYGALVKALLVYGDAAQTYMGVEGELSGVEVDMVQPGEEDDAKLDNNTLSNHGIVSATVKFDSTVKLVFTVYLGTTEGVTVNLNGVACEVTPVEGKAGYYTVSTAAISAVEMCDGFRLTIEGAGDVTPTLEYSINSYAYRTLGNENASDAMKALAAALYYYSKCAQDL